MPPVRGLYNAKGRQSAGGKRKKGKVKKRKIHDNDDDQEEGPSFAAPGVDSAQQDSNVDILTLKSKEEKKAEKKAKMLKEVCLLNMNCN